MMGIIRDNIVFMIPLGMISFLGVFVILQKAFFFWRYRCRNQEKLRIALEYLSDDYPQDAIRQIERDLSPQARILKWAASSMNSYTKASFSWKLESQGVRLIAPFARGVSLLSLLANVSTLTGLLGTVTGMIIAFFSLQQTGSSDPYVLAGGISQALVTTAAGLILAIPFLLFHSYYMSLVRRHRESLEIIMTDILAIREARRKG